MAELDLNGIDAQLAQYDTAIGPGGDKAWRAGQLAQQVRPLVAEVRRLRAELGGQPQTPEVLTVEPGPNVTEVFDHDGDSWQRDPDGDWRHGGNGEATPWVELNGLWAPITAEPPAVGQ